VELETIEIAAPSRKYFVPSVKSNRPLYWDKTHLSQQIEAFKRQVAMANRCFTAGGLSIRAIHFLKYSGHLKEFRTQALRVPFMPLPAPLMMRLKAINMGF
jgi:hypothetical protein